MTTKLAGRSAQRKPHSWPRRQAAQRAGSRERAHFCTPAELAKSAAEHSAARSWKRSQPLRWQQNPTSCDLADLLAATLRGKEKQFSRKSSANISDELGGSPPAAQRTARIPTQRASIAGGTERRLLAGKATRCAERSLRRAQWLSPTRAVARPGSRPRN